jgi:hypothetical protein
MALRTRSHGCLRVAGCSEHPVGSFGQNDGAASRIGALGGLIGGGGAEFQLFQRYVTRPMKPSS